jgi:hypothetical protein
VTLRFVRPPNGSPKSRGHRRRHFLYIKNVKKYARPATTIALWGIKFFVEWTLGRKWTLFDLVRPPREKKLPPS